MHPNKKFAIAVLEKALDDICPRFLTESPQMRKILIKERNTYFTQQEKLLDKEWLDLEREALAAVASLRRERLDVIKKLKKTRKITKINRKIKTLHTNKVNKIKSLRGKLKAESEKLKKQLKGLKRGTKKHAQIQNKLNNFVKSIQNRIESINNKYKTVRDNLIASDNKISVDKRIQQAYTIWDREYKKLKRSYQEKEKIFDTKSQDYDQIRLAIDGFVYEKDSKGGILHWCDVAEIPPLMCYNAVKDRLALLGRTSPEIEEIIKAL